MKKQITFLALAAAASFSASAAEVDITYMGKDLNSPVIKTSVTSSIAAGVLNYVDTVAGSFQAYCIEPAQPNALTAYGAQTYSIGSFTGVQATLLQGLYSSTFGSVHSVNEQAAFQLAVWEITRETAGTLSVSLNSGAFFLKPANSSTDAQQIANSLESIANGYLNAALSYQGPSLYSLSKLTNNTYQDLIYATPAGAVPEPETYALLLAGLGAIGLVARRRLK